MNEPAWLKPLLPEDFKPTVPQVLPIAEAYYGMPEHGVGGSLHIVLDDQNVADSHVQFCIDFAVEHCDEEGYFLGNLLLKMSKSQRARLSDRIGSIESNSKTDRDFWATVDNAGLPR